MLYQDVFNRLDSGKNGRLNAGIPLHLEPFFRLLLFSLIVFELVVTIGISFNRFHQAFAYVVLHQKTPNMFRDVDEVYL